MLIEVLVSAILIVTAAIGVFGAFDAATRSTAQERHRAQANDLAQADLAGMRTMRISDLSNLEETKIVHVGGTPYTVKSTASFQTDSTSTASCQEGVASADYIQIRSKVTWPSIGSRPPVIAQSLVAPPNGSVSAESGALAIQIENAENEGIAGVSLSGAGDGSFAGETGPNGCAVFGNLPAGNYTLTILSSGLVDADGNPPASQSTSVVAESTNTLALQYDEPGGIPVSFETTVGEELVPSEADSVVVFNSGMNVAKTFGTPGTPGPEVTASSLFPFTSPYAVYAGTCEGDNPNPAGLPNPPPAIADVLVTAGGEIPVTLVLPALYLTVRSGASAAEPGVPVSGADIELSDRKCTEEEPFVRSYTTNEEGGLDDPGVPFSEYDVCAHYGEQHVSVSKVSVPANPEDTEAGTTLDVYLSEPGAESGPCP